MRKGTKAAVSAMATMLALAPGMAAAAQPVCLSKTEARSLLTYALPQVISGTGKRCQSQLPASSYLRTHGAELQARYAAQKTRYWPDARAAFLKLSSAKDAQFGELTRKLPDESLRPMVDIAVEGMVEQNIKLKSCDKIDLALDLLSPLPPENTAGLIALFVEIGAQAGRSAAQAADKPASLGGFAICES